MRTKTSAWLARVGVAVAMVLATVPGAWTALDLDRPVAQPTSAPGRTPPGEYVSSDACRSCHPAEYESWHRTYHRTMTQTATTASVRAPDGELLLDGERYAVARRGNEVWAALPPREGVAAGEHRLELTTGSHHYQGYWFAGPKPGELLLFPLVYVFAEQRWLPRRDVFLQPPDAEPHDVRWSSSCIQCHATAGQPGRDPSSARFDTRVAELGIACEACHGPGGEHARSYRSPIARYGAYADDGGGRAIVNPARLPPDRASMVCGQCHAFAYPRDEDEWWLRGYARTFRAGEDLSASRFLIEPSAPDAPPPPFAIDADVESMFWPDGTVRVGGREYNGLVASACFQKGEGARKLSCLSCHSMHGAGDPAGQIGAGRAGNAACLPCHEGEERDIPAHTHHRVGSSGSLCVSCHMPKTTYALLKGIVSHRIDSPEVRAAAGGATARPPACNLCHLDRSLAWTQKLLHDWYGQPSSVHPDGEAQACGPRWLLSGDAALRVIAAAAFGSAGAAEATGTAWQAPLLAEALLDPYAAVRLVAARSLRALPGYEDARVDPVAGPEARALGRDAIRARSVARADRPLLDAASMAALVAHRDERAISISE
jgi:hypothetical protein